MNLMLVVAGMANSHGLGLQVYNIHLLRERSPPLPLRPVIDSQHAYAYVMQETPKTPMQCINQ